MFFSVYCIVTAVLGACIIHQKSESDSTLSLAAACVLASCWPILLILALIAGSTRLPVVCRHIHKQIFNEPKPLSQL